MKYFCKETMETVTADNYKDAFQKLFADDDIEIRSEIYATYANAKLYKHVKKAYQVPCGTSPVTYKEVTKDSLQYDKECTVFPEKLYKPTGEWIEKTAKALYPRFKAISGSYDDYADQILIGDAVHNVYVFGDADLVDGEGSFYQYGIDLGTGAIYKLYYDTDGFEDLSCIDYSKPYTVEEQEHGCLEDNYDDPDELWDGLCKKLKELDGGAVC